jgi:thiamine-phosphate pyrophosphorylase
MSYRLEGLQVLLPLSTVDYAAELAAQGAHIQLREKDPTVSDDALVDFGVQMIDAFPDTSALIINDRVAVALRIRERRPGGLLGVHVGQDDMDAPQVRKLIAESGGDIFLGVSASTVEEARQAEQAGADYIGVGPIFPTASKLDAVPPIGLSRLRVIKSSVLVPVTAIGGISIENAPQVIEARADGIAVIGAVSGSENPRRAARQLVRISGRR